MSVDLLIVLAIVGVFLWFLKWSYGHARWLFWGMVFSAAVKLLSSLLGVR